MLKPWYCPIKRFMMVCTFILAVIWCVPCQARVIIDITAPHLRQIPTAVPYFKILGSEVTHDELSENLSDLLAETIDFTGFFKILDRESFLEDPQKAGLLQHTINFKNWTDVGAELLIKGGFVLQGDLLKVELRLFDTFSGRLIIGKRYTGRLKDRRRIIRRFANDIIKILTGHEGLFDTQIAFVSSGSGQKEIYIADFDGHNPVQFTKTGNITLFPAWSSDGKWLAYTDYKRGKPDLYMTNIREKRGVIAAFKGSSITPAWVPGQFKLAASLSHKGNPSIYLLTGKGKILKKLTHHWGIDVSPSWSPDGKEMAFVSDRSGTPQVYVKNMETDKIRRLTFEGNYNSTPDWSPRGDYIAYSSMVRGEGTNVFIVPAAGGEPLQLTQDSGANESPSWSPDGTLIVFQSNREGPSRIYVMNSNGSNQRRLLFLKGEQSEPCWSPRLSNR